MGACDAIYNKETGAIFTRTPSSWARIGLFYLVYYSCLAIFFAGLLAIFLYSFTDDKAPLLTGSHSVLPQNPGMGFRPRPDEDKTMIKFSKSKASTYQPYIDDMNKFLNPEDLPNTYVKGQSDQDYLDCKDIDQPRNESKWSSKPCKFLLKDHRDIMDNCVNSNFGFEDGTPCFAIKLNKIFEFIPEVDGPYLRLQCEGEYAADKDNLGPLEYYPKNGDVPVAFYPYVGQKGYLSPLVFVKMQKPATGVLLQVVCKPVNARNIRQNKMSNGDGRVTLEILIDE